MELADQTIFRKYYVHDEHRRRLHRASVHRLRRELRGRRHPVS